MYMYVVHYIPYFNKDQSTVFVYTVEVSAYGRLKMQCLYVHVAGNILSVRLWEVSAYLWRFDHSLILHVLLIIIIIPLSPGRNTIFSKMVTIDQNTLCTTSNINTIWKVLFGVCHKSPQQTYRKSQIGLKSVQNEKMKNVQKYLIPCLYWLYP